MIRQIVLTGRNAYGELAEFTRWNNRDTWHPWNHFVATVRRTVRIHDTWRYWLEIDGKRRPVEFLHFRFEQRALPLADPDDCEPLGSDDPLNAWNARYHNLAL